MNYLPLVCTLVGAVGVLYAIIVAGMVKGSPAGNERMQQISGAIAEGAIAYLNRQLKSVAITGIIIFAIMAVTMKLTTAIGFLIGATASYLAGYIGMRVSVIANVRVAEAAKKGLNAALQLAFRGGSVTGMIVAGLALVAVAGYYALLINMGNSSRDAVVALVALGFGGSLISIFARLGGGIFTKGADVGADLVGKVEKGIPEDDPRNPAVIADLVGDNVGDCAGMAADLFETYAVTAVAAMLLGNLLFPKTLPLPPSSRWCWAPSPSWPPSSRCSLSAWAKASTSWAPYTRACSAAPSYRPSPFSSLSRTWCRGSPSSAASRFRR